MREGRHPLALPPHALAFPPHVLAFPPHSPISGKAYSVLQVPWCSADYYFFKMILHCVIPTEVLVGHQNQLHDGERYVVDMLNAWATCTLTGLKKARGASKYLWVFIKTHVTHSWIVYKHCFAPCIYYSFSKCSNCITEVHLKHCSLLGMCRRLAMFPL